MYEIFEQLLRERGITAYRVSKDTGITSATLSDWKKGKTQPKVDKLQKIADYFGVSLDYLCGKGERTDKKESPPAENTVEELIARECAGLSEADRQTVLDYIRFLKSKQ